MLYLLEGSKIQINKGLIHRLIKIRIRDQPQISLTIQDNTVVLYHYTLSQMIRVLFTTLTQKRKEYVK